jgi:FdhE protein
VEKDFIELWWEPFCPVCGRKSKVARMRKGKRYMACSYCGCQYLTDRFICPVCTNNDPTTQGFISFPENLAYEINYCEACNQYIKVIYEERMRKKIPEGLEDLLTRELDIFAQSEEIGFIRA